MSPETPLPAYRSWRPVALAVSGCLFVLNLDSVIIATSLPQIAASFHRTPVDLSLGITAFILAGAAVMPLSRWLADRFGARTVLLAALAIFTLASVGCGAADSFWAFIFARVLQGAGGAVLAPVGQAVVLRAADREHTIQAVGLVTWPALIAPVLGPVIGGFITTYASWRWNFLLNVPVGLLLAIPVAWLVRNEKVERPGRIDFSGLGMTSGALVCLLAGLNLGSSGGRRWQGLLLAALGLLLGALALRHLKRHPSPLLNLSPMRLRSFAVSMAGAGIPFRAFFGATPFLLPLMFQIGYRLTPASTGMLLLVYFAGNLLTKMVTTAIIRRVGFRRLLLANGAAVAASLLWCGWLSPFLPRDVLVAALFFAGCLRSLMFTTLSTLAFADVEPAAKGDAATLGAMILQASMAAGIGGSALLLTLAAGRHPGGLGIQDFRTVFIILAGLAVLCAPFFLRLPRTAGAAIGAAVPKT